MVLEILTILCYNTCMVAIEEIMGLSMDHLPSIVVLSGDDLGQYTQVKQALLDQVGYEPSDISQAFYDVSKDDVSAVLEELESLPFFGGDKLIIVDQLLDITTQKKQYVTDEELAKLEAYATQPNPENHLVLLAPGKIDGKRRLVKILKKGARVIEANSLSEKEIRDYATRLVEESAISFDKKGLDILLERSVYDYATLVSNVALLEAYKESGRISDKELVTILPKSLQDNVFDMIQLILKGRVDHMNQLIKDLRLQGEDDIKLLAILISQFRLFLQAKLLSSKFPAQKELTAALSDILGRKVNPFQVKFALKDATNLPIDFLRKTLSILIETDYHMKRSTYEKAYLFDQALLNITLSCPLVK